MYRNSRLQYFCCWYTKRTYTTILQFVISTFLNVHYTSSVPITLVFVTDLFVNVLLLAKISFNHEGSPNNQKNLINNSLIMKFTRALIKIVILFLSQIIKVLIGSWYLFEIEANIFCNTCNTGWLLMTKITFLEYKCHSFQTCHIKDCYKNDCSWGRDLLVLAVYREEQNGLARFRQF